MYSHKLQHIPIFTISHSTLSTDHYIFGFTTSADFYNILDIRNVVLKCTDATRLKRVQLQGIDRSLRISSVARENVEGAIGFRHTLGFQEEIPIAVASAAAKPHPQG